MTGEEALDADVLVELGPMDAMATADELPFGLLGGRSMRKTRIPGYGHRHTTSVYQVHHEHVLGDPDVLGERLSNFKR